jgi:short-subunit dehydrogenase
VAISETLAAELAADNIYVSVVCPSFFRTNLNASMRAANSDVAHLADGLITRAAKGADDIADRVFRGVAHRRFRIVTHADAQAAWMMKRLAPVSVYLKAMKEGSKQIMSRRKA